MGYAARSSSTVWRSLLSRLHGQQNPFTPTSSSSSSGGAILKGLRFMSSAPSPKLFVGGLSWSTDEEKLRESFTDFGEIAEVKIILDRETGRSRGFGFVTYMSTDDAETAHKEMNNTNIDGRSIRVDFASEKPRSFGGGYGGGGGGYGGGYGGGGAEGASGVGGGDSSFGSKEGSSWFGNNDVSGKDSNEGQTKVDSVSDFDFDNDSFGDNKNKY